MLYLILAIIFGSLFSVVFKVCQNLGINSREVVLFNYITAALFSLVPLLLQKEVPLSEITLSGTTWVFATIQGVLFMMGFMLMDICVWRAGVALSTIAARASLILPVILSYAFLGQQAPAWLPVAGILVAMGLIILPAESQKHEGVQLTSRTDKQRRRRMELELLLVFLCYGVSDFGVKVSQNSVATSLAPGKDLDLHLSALMVIIFLSATLASFVWCASKGMFKKDPVNWKVLLGGLVLGLVNVFCTSSSLKALSLISTSLYYPLYNIGIVIVATLVGLCFFKEKIKWIQVGGIALSIIAIILFFR